MNLGNRSTSLFSMAVEALLAFALFFSDMTRMTPLYTTVPSLNMEANRRLLQQYIFDVEVDRTHKYEHRGVIRLAGLSPRNPPECTRRRWSNDEVFSYATATLEATYAGGKRYFEEYVKLFEDAMKACL